MHRGDAFKEARVLAEGGGGSEQPAIAQLPLDDIQSAGSIDQPLRVFDDFLKDEDD